MITPLMAAQNLATAAMIAAAALPSRLRMPPAAPWRGVPKARSAPSCSVAGSGASVWEVCVGAATAAVGYVCAAPDGYVCVARATAGGAGTVGIVRSSLSIHTIFAGPLRAPSTSQRFSRA